MCEKNYIRYSIPNERVLNIADEYHDAAKTLEKVDGMLMVQLNIAAFAIELYFKSLSSTIEESKCNNSIVYKLFPVPRTREHKLTKLFDKLPKDIKSNMRKEFKKNNIEPFEKVLCKYKNVYHKSRYPFTENYNFSNVSVTELYSILNFLFNYVHSLEREEWVEYMNSQGHR